MALTYVHPQPWKLFLPNAFQKLPRLSTEHLYNRLMIVQELRPLSHCDLIKYTLAGIAKPLVSPMHAVTVHISPVSLNLASSHLHTKNIVSMYQHKYVHLMAPFPFSHIACMYVLYSANWIVRKCQAIICKGLHSKAQIVCGMNTCTHLSTRSKVRTL